MRERTPRAPGAWLEAETGEEQCADVPHTPPLGRRRANLCPMQIDQAEIEATPREGFDRVEAMADVEIAMIHAASMQLPDHAAETARQFQSRTRVEVNGIRTFEEILETPVSIERITDDERSARQR